jgi:hypothetical protein
VEEHVAGPIAGNLSVTAILSLSLPMDGLIHRSDRALLRNNYTESLFRYEETTVSHSW